MSDISLDCTRCGACCFGGHDRYVALLSEDRARPIPRDALFESEGRRYMRMSGGHCAQLMRSLACETLCAVYEVRPEACRAFRAGSFECRMSRIHRGAEAELFRMAPVVEVALPGEGEAPEGVPEAFVIDAPGTNDPHV